MATDLEKFQFKSKFMRKSNKTVVLVILLNFTCCILVGLVNCSKEGQCIQECQHGICKDETCECQPGWGGNNCQFCTGRVRLWNESGIITDGAGNYSEDNKCTWLIDPDRPNSSIRLYLNHFATECSWDHLYIYDGGSIYDPLLAVFSGMVVKDILETIRIPEIEAKSGRALLYFYSDAAYNLTGFSITYKVDGCPSSAGSDNECSGHGVCLEGECTCDGGWSGASCNQPICPANCSGHGTCDMEMHQCICHSGYVGDNCNQKMELGWWEFDQPENENDVTLAHDLARASHTSVAIKDEVWVIGGYSFSDKPFVVAKNLTANIIQRIEPASKDNPDFRYGHSAVAYNGSIYIYGGTQFDGTESDELWKFDPDERYWTLVEGKSSYRSSFVNKHNEKGSRRHSFDENKVKGKVEDRKDGQKLDELSETSCLSQPSAPCTPISCAGHTAVVVKDLFMLIIFGHSSIYGPLNLVQEYHFKSNQWKLVESEGALVDGVYGHTAVWDSETSLVFIYGGLRSATSNSVVADLLAYDPFSRKWKLKTPAPLPRFLHSAILMPGSMLIYGGNTHNDTAFSFGAKCYSSDVLLYDIHCNTWHTLLNPPDLGIAVARYGHSAINSEGTMVILAGFNGRMLESILRYHPGKCESFLTKLKCLMAYPGQKCIWNRVLERCELLRLQDKTAHDFCPPKSVHKSLNYTSLCSSLTSCHSCLYNSFGCVWCSSGCVYEKCIDYTKGVVLSELCEDRKRWWCKSFKSCKLCHTYQPYCDWINKECIFAPGNSSADSSSEQPSSSGLLSTTEEPQTQTLPSPANSASATTLSPFSHLASPPSTCTLSCSQRTTCVNCTQGPCMWCFNQQRCVSNNSYLVSFPYGQCREWATETRRCLYVEKGLSRCMVHQTCKRCQADVGCGWCDDGSNTGTGVCLEGGQIGPVNPGSGDLLPRKCPKSQWFFTTCPACNCNGHSHCVNDTCVQPCANNTRGKHCSKCKESFYGKPINGGLCKSCQCNEHGITCEHDTGTCHCHTKGVIGDHCQRCDTQNNYYGEPLKGSCFYDLQIDYQFTFNLSKQEDIHIRRINFYNVPSKSEVDTDFDIQCSKPARITLSAKQTGGHETFIIKNFTGLSIKRRFSASDYVFGSAANNTTFHVYVFNFTPPIEIIISFSQHPKLDLIQFFSIFSLCFMVLLLMAFIMWKIKQKYDLYTRRQRLMVEMEAMASRPFRSIFLELQLNASDCPSTETVRLKREFSEPESIKEPIDESSSTTNGSTKEILSCLKDGNVSTISVQSHIKKETRSLASRVGWKSDKLNTKTSDNHVSSSALNGGHQKGNCNGTVNNIMHPQMLLHIPNTPLIKKMNNPSPVALEPCAGGMAAVLSMLVQLPTGGTKHTPPGHPGGLAIASALVSLGPPRRTSLDNPLLTKDISKGKRYKESSNIRSHNTRM